MSAQEPIAATGTTGAPAAETPPAAPAELAPLNELADLFPKPDDEAYGLIYAVQEHFLDEQVAALKRAIGQVPPAIQAAWSDRWREEKVADGEDVAWGQRADQATRILVGLLGCIRGGVLDDAREALVKVGQPALAFLDGATDFGFTVDNQDGHNIMELFGEKNMWEKQLRITTGKIDPKRGGIVMKVLGFFS